MAISAPPVRMPIIGKADAGKDVGEEEPLPPAGEGVRRCSLCVNQHGSSSKNENHVIQLYHLWLI